MKKPKYSYRNKLINSAILLIVATLVLSSAQGAFVSDTNNVLTVPELVSAHPAEMKASSAVNPPADTRVDFLGYDDGTTENAYAWTSGDPWQCAIQLTDTQLTGYRDYEITEVMFSCGSDSYGFYIADYEIWISDQLEDPAAPPQVYATGTSSGTGWDTVTLDMAYDIPDTGDVYVGISYSNYGGDYPAGVDDSQSVPEGDWLYYSGTWQHLGDLVGYLYVWGLDAGVTPGGPGAEHDVAFVSINSPESGAGGPSFTPEASIKNNGNFTENVDVQMTIDKVGSGVEYDETVNVDIVVGETLDVEFPLWIPDDWHVADGIDVDYDIDVEVFLTGDEVPDNNAGSDSIMLSYPFLHDLAITNVEPSEGGPAQTQSVEITVENVGQYTESAFKGFAEIGGIAPYTQVFSEGFEGFTPGAAEFPPAGWNVVDVNGGRGWIQYDYSYPRTGTYCARCQYDYYPYYPNDDWLITGPTVVPSGGGTFEFWARGYISYYAEDFVVWYSTTGNTTDDFTVSGTMLADTFVQSSTYQQFSYDMSAEAGNTVWFAIQYDDYYEWYLHIDDVTFPDGSFEGFEGTPDSGFPPYGWTQQIYGGTGVWTGEAYGEETYEPGGDGLYYAEADSDEYSTDVFDVGLFTPALDLTGFVVARLEVDKRFECYGASGSQEGQINVYSGGTAPENFEEQLALYDSDDGGPKHEILDMAIGTYSSPDEVYIEFLYDTKGGTYEWNFKIDDVEVWASTINAEYTDFDFYLSDLAPGESVDITLADWTPDALDDDISGTVEYVVRGFHNFGGDTNSGNDAYAFKIELDYWHDVGIQDITSPGRTLDFLGYDDGTTENAYAWTSGDPWQCAIQLTDTQLSAYRDYDITEVKFSCGSDSYGFYIADYEIWISDQLEDPAAPPQVYATGTSSGTGWDIVTLDMPYAIPDTGDVYVGISYSNYGGNWPAGVDDSQSVPEGDWLYYSGTWQHLGDLVGYLYVWGLDAGVTPGGGPPPVDTYVKLGDTADLSAIVENIGTFDENDLTCWADLFSYNETGVPTLIYEANITDIDLDPLGGQEALDFGQWTFDIEGPYGFFLDLPLGVDDFPGNNEADIGIGVDGSAPTADHAIDPASATGSNGWWVDPVEVTLTAEDVDGLYNSGIDVIQYQIDGGATQTYTAPFTVSDDGEHTVEYWAIDNVGYESTHGTVSFKIDMTPPTIDLTWEAGDGKNEIIFTATCSDATSDMDKVEFFINDVLQFTGTSAPYTWTMVHGAGTKYTVKAVAYDMAGLTDFDEIGSGEGLITVNVNTVPNPLIK